MGFIPKWVQIRASSSRARPQIPTFSTSKFPNGRARVANMLYMWPLMAGAIKTNPEASPGELLKMAEGTNNALSPPYGKG